jgi:alkaline phosphatase D
VSPLTSGAYARKETNELSVTGTYVDQRCFATLTFSGPKKERVLSMALHDAEGKLLWKREVKAPAKR